MRAIRNRALTLILLLLAACGGSDAVKMYEGVEKTQDVLATVRLWSPDLSVTAIDGKPTPSGTRTTHAFVEPGEHEFTLAYLGAGGRTEAKLRTLTRAARTYVFGAKEMSVGRYSFFIEDKGRDYDPACLRPDGAGMNC